MAGIHPSPEGTPLVYRITIHLPGVSAPFVVVRDLGTVRRTV